MKPRPLWRDRRAVVAVWFAVAAPGMIMTAALGVEVSIWMLNRAELQSIADSAAQSGAMEYGATSSASGAANMAAKMAEANGVKGAASRVWTANTSTLADNMVSVQIKAGPRNAAHTGVYVTVQRAVVNNFPFLTMTGQTHTETATAVAEIWTTPAPACVVAKNGTASKAIRVDNMGTITSTGCAITSNSNAPDAVYLNSGTISGPSVNAVGGITITNSGSNTFSPSPGTSNATAAADPYAAMTAPTAGACNYTNASFTAWQATPYAFTQAANVFCGNTTIGGNASTDTFAPGIYYVVNGNLTFNNAAITSAVGVTFVLTGSSPGAISWTNYSNTTTQITAPTTGATAGIAFWQTCPASGSAPANTMAGGSTLALTGAFYTPCGALNINNNAKLAAVSGGSMSVVASTIYAAGSASITAVSAGSSGQASVSTALVQ